MLHPRLIIATNDHDGAADAGGCAIVCGTGLPIVQFGFPSKSHVLGADLVGYSAAPELRLLVVLSGAGLVASSPDARGVAEGLACPARG